MKHILGFSVFFVIFGSIFGFLVSVELVKDTIGTAVFTGNFITIIAAVAFISVLALSAYLYLRDFLR